MGIIQGLTEFLPVSSSGHLVLFQKLFGISEGTLLFTTMLHVGTLASVVVVFWKDILEIIRKPFSKLTLLLIAATIPTVIIALVLKDSVEAAFQSASTLGIGFLITGIVLWGVESAKPGNKVLKEMSWKDALVIGVAQGFAIFPAVSRSGSTIAGALFQKLDRKFAARFSFLLSMPAIMGSIVFQVKDIVAVGQSSEVLPIIVGTLVAAISGFFAIKLMLDIITRKSLKIFAYYVFGLGSLILLDQFVFHFFF